MDFPSERENLIDLVEVSILQGGIVCPQCSEGGGARVEPILAPRRAQDNRIVVPLLKGEGFYRTSPSLHCLGLFVVEAGDVDEGETSLWVNNQVAQKEECQAA